MRNVDINRRNSTAHSFILALIFQPWPKQFFLIFGMVYGFLMIQILMHNQEWQQVTASRYKPLKNKGLAMRLYYLALQIGWEKSNKVNIIQLIAELYLLTIYQLYSMGLQRHRPIL